MTQPPSAPSAALPEDRLRAVAAICDWLLGEARAILDPDIILEGLCLKLRAAGVAVDRGISSIELRHAEQAANARIWEIGRAAREHVYGHARGVSPMSGRRPLAKAHRTNR
jgi:hypothetical protein